MGLKEYFTDKNYIAFYSFTFFHKFAGAIVGFFTGALFFSLGMPLYLILLFFGLEFIFKGLFAPLGPKFATSYGITKSMLISNIAYILFFVFISLSEYSLSIAFFSFIFRSFSTGIQSTINEGMQSKLIKNENRGRQQSLIFILKSATGLIAITFGALILEYSSYWIIAIVVSIFLLFSTFSFSFLEKINFKNKFTYKNIFSKLISEDYKENYFPMFGQALALIANITFIPIFIFMQVRSFKLFGIILFSVYLTEILLIFLLGRILDKKDPKKLNQKTAYLNILGNIGLLLFSKNPITLLLANTYNQISWNLYFNNALVRQLNKAKNKSFVFMTLIQMNLCFVKVFVLGIFSIIAFLFGDIVSYFIFLSSIFGVFIFSRYFKD